MLRYLTGGESHGKCLVAIIDGMPAGVEIDAGRINRDLVRRQAGFGRGKRMAIEKDKVEILSGTKNDRTLGSPVTLSIRNVDHSLGSLGAVFAPRPGHADLTGALKYGHLDMRNVLERASARDTAARVAVGAVTKALLKEFGIDVIGHVVAIGGVEAHLHQHSFRQIVDWAERSAVRCADPEATKMMCRAISDAAEEGDTLGGVFEVWARGVPPGLGSYAQWDRRLDGILARAVMSVQAVKAVEFGMGFAAGSRKGSAVHDEIFYERGSGFTRETNHAGGIEGGMSNGETIIIRAAMKPIATLRTPLRSVHIKTKRQVEAARERSDTCAVPACSVVAEAVTAFAVANAFLEKFGGDSTKEIWHNYEGYMKQVRKV